MHILLVNKIPLRTLHSELLSLLSRSLIEMRYVGSRLTGALNQAFLVYVCYTKVYISTIDYETMKQTQRARSYLCGLDRNTNMQWPRQRIAEVISGVECKISHVELRWGDRLRDLWIRGSQSLPSTVQFSSVHLHARNMGKCLVQTGPSHTRARPNLSDCGNKRQSEN